jgi:cytochrome c-type biogenesis protein CcmH
MVDGLAARLKQDGKDLGGWMQLVRAYVVLGRSQDATSALAQARGNFAGDEKSLAELEALAQSLGLGS